MKTKKDKFEPVGAECMTDAELSKQLGSYQRTESIGMLLGVLLVIAGCIMMFVYRNIAVICILVFAGVALFLLVAKPAQTKKKALMQQQLGGFFHTELTKAFGPEPEPATLPIDRAYLKAVKLSAVDFTECTVTDFHEGEHKGLRFSAANVELRRTVEEKSGHEQRQLDDPDRDAVPRHRGPLQGHLQSGAGHRPERHVPGAEEGRHHRPAAFRKHFAAHTADGREVNDLVTPQLRDLVQKLEASSGSAKLCGLILRDGDLTLALNTRYVFAGVPEELDLRDIDGIRKWFTASLTGMGNLLDLITESPALTGAAE
ncbi:MAG: hypothetical protein ACLSHJ_07130 [Oscillospiraceae bacterium]